LCQQRLQLPHFDARGDRVDDPVFQQHGAAQQLNSEDHLVEAIGLGADDHADSACTTRRHLGLKESVYGLRRHVAVTWATTASDWCDERQEQQNLK
jgi:hypothetical protein